MPYPNLPAGMYPGQNLYRSISDQMRPQQASAFVTDNNQQQPTGGLQPIPQGGSAARGALARQMMATGSSTAPVRSPLEGLARALQGGIGGYIQGQEGRADTARQEALGGRIGQLTGLDEEQAQGLTPDQALAVAGVRTKQAEAGQKLAAAGAKKGEKQFTQEKDLRKEYSGLAKDFREQRGAYNRVINSAKDPSAAGDLALIFNYMKVLDPGSTVREGEFATAAASGAFGDRLRGAAERIISGKRLSDAQRRDFVDRAGRLYGGALETQRGLEEEYRGLAGEYGVTPGRVVPDYVRGLEVADLEEIMGPLDPGQTPLPTADASIVGGNEAGIEVPPEIGTEAEYNKLPSGATYRKPGDPVGRVRTKK